MAPVLLRIEFGLRLVSTGIIYMQVAIKMTDGEVISYLDAKKTQTSRAVVKHLFVAPDESYSPKAYARIP